MLVTGGLTFDLVRFSRAIEIGALDYLTAQYAADAEIRIVDPAHPTEQPTVLVGSLAIKAWRQSLWLDYASHSVVKHLIGDHRVMFVEHRVHYDGVSVVSTSTAELDGELITAQHTVEVWDDERER